MVYEEQLATTLPRKHAEALRAASAHRKGGGAGLYTPRASAVLEKVIAAVKNECPHAFHAPHTLRTRVFYDEPVIDITGRAIPMVGFVRLLPPEIRSRRAIITAVGA